MTEQPAPRRVKRVAAAKPHAAEPQQRYKHFIELARAETLRGDTVAAENFYQHAEHFYRAMNVES